MLNIGTFYDGIRTLAKRGSSLDEEIPGAARRAVRWVEQNYTLGYMRKRFRVEVPLGGEEVDLPKVAYKSILAARWRDSDEGWVTLRGRDYEDDYSWEPTGVRFVPTQYMIEGTHTMLLDVPAPAAIKIEGWMARYTDWPKNEDEGHWLLEHAEGVMRAQTMLELAVFNRDDRNYQIMQMYRDEQMRVLQNADHEARFANQDIRFSGG